MIHGRASIGPPPPGTAVAWSVMIPTYNCTAYLAECLRSVLAQAPPTDEMQIEVVDDASSDQPEAVVEQVGKGRVSFHRQPRNVGHVDNFACAIRRARGRYVHLLHGDDRVEPGFYAALRTGFEADPDAVLAFCRHRFIDASGDELSISPLEADRPGRLRDALLRLAEEQRIMTPSVAVRRAAYEQVGGFDPSLRCSEDWEMWVRLAARGAVWYEPRVLASYRMHGGGNTGRSFRFAGELAYTRKAIDIFSDYLSEADRGPVRRRARGTYARVAVRNAVRLAQSGDPLGAVAHAWGALRLDPRPLVLARAAVAAARSCT
jgi:glycosyltransferase involved in cell wall biosynthesis